MNELKIQINSIEEMWDFAKDLVKYCKPNQVIALNGDLGAGKTTFTKGIGQALGVERVINSPTFTIMKIYDVTNHVNDIKKLYHLDVYRIGSSYDFDDDFELEEYFYQNGLTIIEWANIIEDLLPEDTWVINIYRLSDVKRLVELKNFPDEVIKTIGEKYEIVNR